MFLVEQVLLINKNKMEIECLNPDRTFSPNHVNCRVIRTFCYLEQLILKSDAHAKELTSERYR